MGTALIVLGGFLLLIEAVAILSSAPRGWQLAAGIFAASVLSAGAAYLGARWQYKPDRTPQQIEDQVDDLWKVPWDKLVAQNDELKRTLRHTEDANTSLAIKEFGGDLQFYYRWHPNEEAAGKKIEFGMCGATPCPALTLLSITSPGHSDAAVRMRIEHAGMPTLAIWLPLKRGCHRALLRTPDYTLNVIVEDDSNQSPVLGVVFVRRLSENPMPPKRSGGVPASDWTRSKSFAFGTPPPEYTCGAEVRSCTPRSETDIADPLACVKGEIVTP